VAELRACFPGAERQAAIEWRTDRADRVASARGARVVCVVDRSVHTFGEEACFLKRREKSFVPARGDGNAFRVGEDGWAEGWQASAREARDSLEWDEAGFAIELGVGERLDEIDCSMLDVGMQALARARLRLGDGAKVFSEYRGKLTTQQEKGGAVCLQVQQDNVKKICRWRARIRATAVFATDGSYGATEKEGIHGGASKASRAYVRHCGQEHGGVMASGDGTDNYIAEIEALIEALAAEPEGGRIIIVMDATSPVTAWMRFGRCHNRRKL
jgi:hypothetical protein